MCGIVGLFLKDKTLQPKLGEYLSEMLVIMTDRGPDSAGIAIYGNDEAQKRQKITIQSPSPEHDFKGLVSELSEALDTDITLVQKDTHAVLSLKASALSNIRAVLSELRNNVRIMSIGERIEIYKEVGLPLEVSERFELSHMSGSHGIGHTRMATESSVTTLGAHPFSTGVDQCLVHNGSLSNHNNLRRELIQKGIHFETENDTEVAAAYISHRMDQGDTLGEALESGIKDIDGFYTFVVGTHNGFGVVRDPIACKPAILAETDRYVAFGSEYRALVGLPEIESAQIWEPEPATVYFWEH